MCGSRGCRNLGNGENIIVIDWGGCELACRVNRACRGVRWKIGEEDIRGLRKEEVDEKRRAPVLHDGAQPLLGDIREGGVMIIAGWGGSYGSAAHGIDIGDKY